MTGAGKPRSNLSQAIEIAELSDVGRKRDHNEDHVGSDRAHGLAVLADGMGGHNAGEIASGLAVETILQNLCENLNALSTGVRESEGLAPESVVTRAAIERSNRLINESASNQPQYQGMGTTVVATLFYDDRLTVCHVGDSRVYRFRDGSLEQLTRDHTLLQELVDRGYYSPEEARESLNRNIVTRALGIEPDVEVEVREHAVLPGDIYLLCSDGLNDMLDDDRIGLTLHRFGANLDEAARQLVEQANDEGGSDNISVILVRIVKPFGRRRSWVARMAEWFQ